MPSALPPICSAEDLTAAIKSTDLEVLQRVLQRLCDRVPEARRIVIEEIIVPEDTDDEHEYEDADDGENRDEEEEEVASEPAQGTKRHRARYALCLNCREDYDVTDNEDGDCKYHDGEIEPNDDLFADHDDDIHGDRDGDECKEEYPENYIWTCCDAHNIESGGCKSGKHVEDTGYTPGSKKPKLWE